MLKLDKRGLRNAIGKNRITTRAGKEWNTLSSHVVSANTIDSIKKELPKFMAREGWW